jgi:hypothetical protein
VAKRAKVHGQGSNESLEEAIDAADPVDWSDASRQIASSNASTTPSRWGWQLDAEGSASWRFRPRPSF